MQYVDVVVIGGGQAGLAMSRSLSERGLSHVVLERGRVAQAWRGRWDSLRLLTPNWQARLPGYRYGGAAPNGYMTRSEVVDYLEGYCSFIDAPIQRGVNVSAVSFDRNGTFLVKSNVDAWRSRNVVIATGQCMLPLRPTWAQRLDRSIVQLTTAEYKSPESVPTGGVLVVGASATGVQLAHELRASGREVTVAVGRHCRMPRVYRGLDIMSWLDKTGILRERTDQVRDLGASRRAVSLQLMGSDDARSIDLGTLAQAGVELTGRALEGQGHRVNLARDLHESVAASESKLARLLSRIDHFIEVGDLTSLVGPATRPPPIELPVPDAEIDLSARSIRSVVWATGYRRHYPWLELPVLDDSGEIAHHSGVTRVPGVYVLGLNFQRRRSSSYIDGVGNDARILAQSIQRRLEHAALQHARR